ncbi:hypothetical protein FNV43_RR23906 [Rhamnella rubrinervis]|uniref:Uncharacterized protein n=1 Tax=Rhamnella rubrinervis TaxID=2594499 RepID=A0A8K0GNL3_9ROSA|nr:hypothetical protein FNV43_RR23906 [Rhamnella rubrinervis]
MGSESDPTVKEPSTTLKLSLFSLPSQPPEPSGTLTPPLRTSASIPFQWEEAPGKPRHCNTASEPKSARALELPPRLLSETAKVVNLPSPTTVLDGPDHVCRSMSFTSSLRNNSESLGKRVIGRDGGGYFGSRRWGSFRKSTKEAVLGPSFDFSSYVDGGGDQSQTSSVSTTGSGVQFGGSDHTNVKITRVRRRGSLLNLSHTKSQLLLASSKYDPSNHIVMTSISSFHAS